MKKQFISFCILVLCLAFQGVSLAQESSTNAVDDGEEQQSQSAMATFIRDGEPASFPDKNILFSRQEKSNEQLSIYGLNWDPEEAVFSTENRQLLSFSDPEDCNAIYVGRSESGNFAMIIKFTDEIVCRTEWLFTYDYSGHRIDSLEFRRVFESSEGFISDLSSRLNKDLTIQQTFIDWGTNNPEFMPLIGKSKKGTRFDIEYKIDKTGHFMKTKCVYYKEKVYTDIDLLICRDNEHPRGIHLGKEVLFGNYRCSDEQAAKDKKLNRFPIYGGNGRRSDSAYNSSDSSNSNRGGNAGGGNNRGGNAGGGNNRGRR